MRRVFAAAVLVAFVFSAGPTPAKPWGLAECSRAVLKCKADRDACEAKLRACDVQRASEGVAWAKRLDAARKAAESERVALNGQIAALKAAAKAARPWWESPVFWGVVGAVVGGVTVGAGCRALGGCGR